MKNAKDWSKGQVSRMDREKAIKILTLFREEWDRHSKTPNAKALDMAIEALQEPERKWIPVSERLPDELVAVNVTWINRCPQNYYMHIKDKPFTDTAVLYRGKWYWWDATIIDYLSEYGIRISEAIDKSIDILAWQPLPEPYKGGKD